MGHSEDIRPVNILLIEDNPGDVRLIKETFSEDKFYNRLFVAKDGEEAMNFLRRKEPFPDVPRPDIILLDLNLPKMNGHEVLSEIKSDPDLKTIPVVILTTSDAEQDIQKTYEKHVNCYITKPVDLNQFIRVVKGIEDFWLTMVKLPKKES
ncbi:MAG: response regulator [Candidatus Aureabacteria bacterium]|nr:response regulator [Candidatus Auribacterota bacterium]